MAKRYEILEFLKSKQPYSVSGEELAGLLGVTRTAIWKAVRELRRDGYLIAGRPGAGYALAGSPDRLLPEEIRDGLQTRILGRTIHYRDSTDSTNEVAKALARRGVPGGTLVIAEEQWSGKGRLSREWSSPRGGIWMSLIHRPQIISLLAPRYSLAACVAVARSLHKLGLNPGIKWPNDLLIEGRKVCGILTELWAELDRVEFLIIGIGINANIEQASFPDPIRPLAASLLELLGRKVDRPALVRDLLWELEGLFDLAPGPGFEGLLDEWRRFSVTLGRRVRVKAGGEEISGLARDIDGEGALLLETKDGPRRILAGEVTLGPRPE
ncbi:MAG: biotin--[acetyl-CoA-carboxylase] ligase [Firmicutes bacterium]|nr:biotin--[acetyl-CoA-carboxylase] ligase [Bacillota bacterium]